MSDMAVELYYLGLTLLSGRAEGPDWAFQRGAEYAMTESGGIVRQQIYLPKDSFNRKFGNIGARNPQHWSNYSDAEDIMETLHPKGQYLTGFSRQAHTRNVYQILGDDLATPVSFVICYAKPLGKVRVSGGTATAVALAHRLGIPVYNLYDEKNIEAVYDLIKELKDEASN
ncbi:DprA-like DNA recombination-mediator protein [Pectobacterium phage My1]|uniref:Uncharacterized protein n=1 Tax=Pectobacterium phage My1 TaxID=1204539 RepID=J9QL07_9CAUD|nr:DprA-like DNA recombination-mediator protein [Pectobacterium phage My1]AFQ22269.1 hypothetical protein My1_110 [Pectobacterium phage My1]